MRWLIPLVLAFCALAGPVLAGPVILIGIDGFRADYLDRGLTPTLSRLASEGAMAEDGMRPSFPSVTYPNFYTLVTGRHPDHHGLVYNRMRDPELPGRTFSLGNRQEVMDPVWWDDAEPVWVTAERQGLKTSVLFWPGSEAAIHGVRPRDWLPFEQSISSRARANITLGWFTTPAEDWPDFAAVYFDIVDTQGHHFGPDSPELNAALAEVDEAVRVLVDGLAARGIEADIVAVADHGMAATSSERIVWLDDWIAAAAVDVFTYGPLAFVDPLPGRDAELETALERDPGHMDCWRREDIPARFAYGTHRRISQVVCLADLGWTVGVRGHLDPARVRAGSHGFDPEAPQMQAVFIAHGPSFRPGVRLRDMESVDVQPLLARLLGIVAPPGDGQTARTVSALIAPD